jgi:hypothetical protein
LISAALQACQRITPGNLNVTHISCAIW